MITIAGESRWCRQDKVYPEVVVGVCCYWRRVSNCQGVFPMEVRIWGTGSRGMGALEASDVKSEALQVQGARCPG